MGLKNKIQEVLPGKKVYVQKLKPPFDLIAVYVPSGITPQEELGLGLMEDNFNMISATIGVYLN